VVTPQEDGSIDTRVENFADREQAYAVTATSYLAAHNLVVKLNQGLLTEVSLTKDTSAVAAEAVKAVGEVEKTRIETQTEAAKNARTKAEEEATDAQTKAEAAAKARQELRQRIVDNLAAARVELAQAVAKRDGLPADSKERAEAQLLVVQAQAKVDTLEAQLREFDARKDGAFSLVPDGASTAQIEGFRTVYRPGPVILRIEEDPETPGLLLLIPVSFDGTGGPPQSIFEAYRGAKPPSEPTKPPTQPATKIEFETPSPVAVSTGTGSATTTLRTKIDLAKLAVGGMSGNAGSVPTWWPDVKRIDSKSFELKFKSQTPPDTYTIQFLGREAEDAPNIPGSFIVKVVP
jgi:hypothetical protein